MYNIAIKIPKATYGTEENNIISEIIIAATAIDARLGSFSVSNDVYETLGYTAATDESSKFDSLKATFSEIEIVATEIIEEEI